ncbi:hypothetical protein RJT34_26098 [Clitoria ternatea]|uniref:Uncharacterized protein n=1 Tax=Clitoria ternatea TaxID=43366 RepID=A0AAN9F8U4_CLITE
MTVELFGLLLQEGELESIGAKNIVLMRSNLRQRRVDVDDTCPMCDAHAFWLCPLAKNEHTLRVVDSYMDMYGESSKKPSSTFQSPDHPPTKRNLGSGTRMKNKEALLDLMLLENQIPLFILNKKLFKILFPEKQESELINMALPWFGYSQDWINKSSSTLHLYEVAHFLELVHRLLAAEIKIKPRNREKGNDCPRFQSGLTVNYSQGILEIPLLHINQTTVIEWKNFIAWEHQMYNSIRAGDQPHLFTSLAILFKDLICCASDVKVLKDRGVIVKTDDSKICINKNSSTLHLHAAGHFLELAHNSSPSS